MRVLHVFGDWKWTGPSEPTLDLCLELKALGVDAQLACPKAPPEATTNLPAKARGRGLTPRHDFVLNKKLNLVDNLTDLGRLREACESEGIDILHVQFSHDHLLAGLAGRRAKNKPRIFRTNAKAVPSPRGPGSTFLYRRYTDGYLSYSQRAFDADVPKFRLEGKSWVIPPAMNLARFDPATVPAKDMRGKFGIPADAFVLGVVARMQRHRRFDVLLDAIRRARVPNLRVLVVGRGTHMDEVAVQPARAMGLADRVTFTGYLGEDYLPTVAAFDALAFLVPGSDGTCRALREAMTMGKPVIGADRGMIPELVEHGRTGLVVGDTAENLAAAIEKMAADPARAEMGRRGREKAVATFDSRAQAKAVLAAYEATLRQRT